LVERRTRGRDSPIDLLGISLGNARESRFAIRVYRIGYEIGAARFPLSVDQHRRDTGDLLDVTVRSVPDCRHEHPLV
jgi:hypothetical protein